MSDEKIEIMEAEVVPEAALSIITKAEIDTQIATAKSFPRSMTGFIKKALGMVTVSQGVAESCTYALPRGGKTITGPSIRFAEIVLACYQNIRGGSRVIYKDNQVLRAQGICHDLENNTCITVEVERSILQREMKYNPISRKNEPTGRMVKMSEDMQVMTGNAACAIALRNAVFKVVPMAMANEVYEKAQACARGDESTLPQRREKAIEFFNKLGVKVEQIFAALEVRGIEDIDLDKLQLLTGMKQALNNNEATLADLFPVADADPKTKANKAEKAAEDAIKKEASKAAGK